MSRAVAVSSLVLATATLAAQAGWTQRFPAASPSNRGFHNLAYDLGHSVTVLFGGWDGSYLGDTWAWDGTNWTRLTPAIAPAPRLAHAMAYDLGRGRVVLFGGAVGTGAGIDNDETWEWDGTNWLQLQPAARPSPRRSGDMTFDVARGVCVLFGGGITSAGTTVFNDTWEWNGATWTLRNPPMRPPARWNCFLTCDWGRGYVVMFGGGVGATNQMFADTWTWDGTNWQPRSPLTAPTARRSGASAFDVQHNLLVTWDGMTPGPAGNGSTWVWNAADWHLDPRQPAPAGRWATAGANDLLRGRTVMFGGFNGALFADTWEYEASQPANSSPAGSGCAGAAGVPMLAPDSGTRPVLGTTWTMNLTYGTGPGLAVLAAGTSNQSWAGGSLPQDMGQFGMPGCTMYTSIDWLRTIVLASGTGGQPWALPATPSLAGLPFWAQALVLETPANPFGGILSNALAGMLGPY